MLFLIKCPDCGHSQQLEIDELEDDPKCNICEFYLGWEKISSEEEINDTGIQAIPIRYNTTSP